MIVDFPKYKANAKFATKTESCEAKIHELASNLMHFTFSLNFFLKSVH